MTDRLIEFLKARLKDDEDIARAAKPGPWELRWNGQEHELRSPQSKWPIAEWTYAIYPRGERGDIERAECNTSTQEHIARHDPARVLAEAAAKREILKVAELDLSDDATDETAAHIVKTLAAVYAGHPDFQPDWAIKG